MDGVRRMYEQALYMTFITGYIYQRFGGDIIGYPNVNKR